MIGSMLLMTLTVSTPVQPQHPGVFPYPIDIRDFDNGLRLVGVRFDSPRIAAFYTVVRVGSRQEVEQGKSGFAHFFEHMMFRGTSTYPEDRYNDVLRAIGADSNAYTTFDRTVYHILASSQSLPRIIEIESDRFQNLEYSKEQFQKEAGAVLGEYNKSATNPFMGLYEKLHDTVYDHHPYQHMVIGFLEDIEAMPTLYDHSIEFFDRFYRPEYVTILVVGDYDWDALQRHIEEKYGRWKRGHYLPDIPAEPPQTAPREASVEWLAPTLPILAIGYRAPAFSTERIDMPGLDVLSQVHFGETSPIFQELVIDKQWVDFIQAGATDHADPPIYTILTRVRVPEKLDEVRKALLNELHRISEELAEENQLQATKSHMRYQFLLGLDTADAVANTMAHYLALTNDPKTINRVYELYDSVTAEDVRRLAREYFREETRTIVTLSPAPGVSGEE
ncbi:MAG TPA: pitrilysin family protein [Vicinamibacteria bacterium]|nr:pitrilysin family protein [Vicinamibacteria bacterium]